MRFFVFTVALIAFMAGCVQSPSMSSSSSDEATTPPPTDAPPSGNPSVDVGVRSIPTNAEWTDCEGGLADTTFVHGTQPGNHPPGWGPTAEQRPLVGVFMNFWECGRVHWGPFERPLKMLFETHGNLQSSAGCAGYTGGNALGIDQHGLASVWVNDTEVADWLRTTYGLPVHGGPIEWTHETTGPVETHTLTWGLAGQPQSSITFPLDMAQRETFPEPDWRIFWFNATTLSYLEVSLSYDSAAYFGRQGYGEVHPPMLAAKYTTTFVGTADAFQNGRMSGTIHRFGDFDCQQPLE